MKASINMYKYQNEKEDLLKQNTELRKELEKYRPQNSTTEDLNWALIDLLELQRKRIEFLETGILQS